MVNDENSQELEIFSQNLDTDLTINLENIGHVEALAIVKKAIIDNKSDKEVKILFKFSLSAGEGTPSLFAPIGNLLKEELKSGNIKRAMPIAGGGWIARLNSK